MKKKYTQLTPETYMQLKTLTNAIPNTKTLLVATGRSAGTLSYVRKSKDFTDYRAIVSASTNQRRQPAPMPPQPEAEQLPLPDDNPKEGFYIRCIAIGNLGGLQKVFGVNAVDNKVYYYTSKGWEKLGNV